MQLARCPRRPRRPVVLAVVAVAVALGAATAGAMSLLTYNNLTPITINDAAGGTPPTPATPYPSNIAVPPVGGTVSSLSITINGLTHTFPDDVDMLLVSPNGSKMEIWSDACGALPMSNVFVVVSDAAASALPDAGPCLSTVYKPADYGVVQDPFPSPAPAGPYAVPAPGGSATLNGTFGGVSPTGTWSLYVVDDLSGDSGSITSGWSLNLQGPTGINVASFVATRTRAGVRLTWRSGSEESLAGFNLYRSGTRLNRTLIGAKTSGTARGASYSFLDRAARAAVHYTYRLETVGLDGTRTSRVFATP
jgi:subtilisin-like proprotein convertase family protein